MENAKWKPRLFVVNLMAMVMRVAVLLLWTAMVLSSVIAMPFIAEDGSSFDGKPPWLEAGVLTLGRVPPYGGSSEYEYSYNVIWVNGDIARIDVTIARLPLEPYVVVDVSCYVNVSSRWWLNASGYPNLRYPNRYFDWWIPTDLEVGDVVYTSPVTVPPVSEEVLGQNYPYEVVGIVYLFERRAFKLTYEYNESLKFYAYYDCETGIKLLSYSVNQLAKVKTRYYFVHEKTYGAAIHEVIVPTNVYARMFGSSEVLVDPVSVLVVPTIAALLLRLRLEKRNPVGSNKLRRA